jgi:hypothetical protein
MENNPVELRATFCSAALLVGVCLSSLLPGAVRASTSFGFEGPDDGQPVSGISIVRGWAFDTDPSTQLNHVSLFVDGAAQGDIPYGSTRPDVQQAFPGAQNALNSGWGLTFNWGILTSGVHTVRVDLQSNNGSVVSTDTRTVTVVKPGDFSFLDMFDPSGATVSIGGNQLTLHGVLVRDKETQQEPVIDATFQWFSNAQSLGMVNAQTMVASGSVRSLPLAAHSWVRALSHTVFGWLAGSVREAQAQPVMGGPGGSPGAMGGMMGAFESPAPNQPAGGIGILRGWTFSTQSAASVTGVSLTIDGASMGTVPCCSERSDVGQAYPTYPSAANSGWGLTINYSELSAGPHVLSVGMGDSMGGHMQLANNITVVRPGGVSFLDQFDLSGATASIDGQDIVLSGVQVRDKATQQQKVIGVRFRWSADSQSLVMVQADD